MTVRQWYRLMRSVYQPRSEEERGCLQALRTGELINAEFWLLLCLSKQREIRRDVRGHLWYLDGYAWRCEQCPASLPSDSVHETEPPNMFDPECRCAACLPCQGSGQ
jgi:hypothetical protein